MLLVGLVLFVLFAVVSYHVAYQRYLAFGITKPAPKALRVISQFVWRVKKAYLQRIRKKALLYVNTEEPDIDSIELGLLRAKQYASDPYRLGLYEVYLVLPSNKTINTRVLITRDEAFYSLSSHYQINVVEYL